MISLTEGELGIVRSILKRHAADIEVRVFGSRTRPAHKRFSDLDLALMADRPISLHDIATLEEAFSESDLPFRVDLLDWAVTSDEIKRCIAHQLVPLR